MKKLLEQLEVAQSAAQEVYVHAAEMTMKDDAEEIRQKYEALCRFAHYVSELLALAVEATRCICTVMREN